MSYFYPQQAISRGPICCRFVLRSKSIAIFKYLISQIWDLIRIWGFRSGLNMKPLNTSILFIYIYLFIYIFSISFDLNLAQEVNISQLENYAHLKMLSINRKEGFLNPTKWNFGVLLWACSVLTFWMGLGIPPIIPKMSSMQHSVWLTFRCSGRHIL